MSIADLISDGKLCRKCGYAIRAESMGVPRVCLNCRRMKPADGCRHPYKIKCKRQTKLNKQPEHNHMSDLIEKFQKDKERLIELKNSGDANDSQLKEIDVTLEELEVGMTAIAEAKALRLITGET